MKAKTTRTAILNALAACGPAVAGKTTKPVLECVRIEAATDGSLTFQATDNEIGIVYTVIGSEVREPGVTAIRPDRLGAIVKDSVTEDVTIETDGDSCRVTAGGKFKLATEDANTFPDVRDVTEDADAELELTGSVVRDVLAKVAFAANAKSENTNWALSGVAVKCDGEKASFAATDTRRLAVLDSVETAAKCQAIIPVKGLSIACKSISGDAEKVTMKVSSTAVTFQTERAMICCRLIAGRFPPFDQIIPKKFKGKAELPTQDTIRCLRQSSVTADVEATAVNWKFQGESLSLSSESSKGDSEVELPIGGGMDDFEIKLPPDHILSVLRLVESPTVEMHLTGEGKPVVFRPEPGWTYLVMPMAG